MLTPELAVVPIEEEPEQEEIATVIDESDNDESPGTLKDQLINVAKVTVVANSNVSDKEGVKKSGGANKFVIIIAAILVVLLLVIAISIAFRFIQKKRISKPVVVVIQGQEAESQEKQDA